MGVTTVPYYPPTRQQRSHCWGRKQERYERAFDQPGQYIHRWRKGDIAFLKPEDAFTAEEHKALVQPSAPGNRYGYLPPKATGHPVIILSEPTEKSTHVLVTPVSAYSSSEQNNYLPPWKQEPHQWKEPRGFRSFHGCERYSDEFPHLYLEGGKSMPKPRTSWLYIQSLWAVPLTVIGRFTKTRDFLRVRQDSLESLLNHMKAENKRWKECMAEMEAYEREANGIVDSTPAGITNWRTSSSPPGPGPIPIPAARNRKSSYTAPVQSYTITYDYSRSKSPSSLSSSPCSWANVARINNSTTNGNSNANTTSSKTMDNTNSTCVISSSSRRSPANTGRNYNQNYAHHHHHHHHPTKDYQPRQLNNKQHHHHQGPPQLNLQLHNEVNYALPKSGAHNNNYFSSKGTRKAFSSTDWRRSGTTA